MTTQTGAQTVNSHITRPSAHGIMTALLLFSSSVCFAQRDAGIRGDSPDAGKPLDGLTPIELSLHDGRTADLLKAIEAHYSPPEECQDDDDRRMRSACYGPSEANAVVGRLKALAPHDQQAVLDFLRAL
jgi:hypothetical protein